jgi:hypothetical protein
MRPNPLLQMLRHLEEVLHEQLQVSQAAYRNWGGNCVTVSTIVVESRAFRPL